MQLDPAMMLMSHDAVPFTPNGGPADAAVVSDVFAALLAAAIPAAPALGGNAQATVGEISAAEAEEASTQAAPGPSPTAVGILGGMPAEASVVSGPAAAAGAIEVPRDATGLPLKAGAPVQEAVADAAAVPPRIATAATGGEAAPPADPAPAKTAAQPKSAVPFLAGMDAEADIESTVDPRIVKSATASGGSAGKQDTAMTPMAADPEASYPGGRPVRTTPAPSIAAAAKPEATPGVEGEPQAEGDVATAAPTGDAADPRNAGGPPATPATGATAPTASPEPRPPVWQPELGATPAAVAAPPTGPELAPAAPGHAAAATVEADNPRPADPQHIQAQVLRQVLGRMDRADGRPQEIVLRLDPEHLGKVEVRLVSRGDQLQVEFVAEKAEAGQALAEGRQELVRSLTAQTGRWQHVEIKVVEPDGPAAKADEPEDERSEHGSRRERDQHQRRRRGDER